MYSDGNNFSSPFIKVAECIPPKLAGAIILNSNIRETKIWAKTTILELYYT